MKVIKGLALVIISLFVSASAGADMNAIQVAQKVQSLYDKTYTLKADFVQKATMKSLSISEQDNGVVYMKKDGKIRWDYKSPKKQLIVSDGKTIWFYMPSDNQVIIGSFAKSFKYKPTQTFLTGMGRILEDFNVKFGNTKELSNTSGEYVLELIPKNHTDESPAKILLSVNKKDFLIEKSTIVDRFGNITEIDFNNIKLNTNLPDKLFTFIPPKDVEIIHSPEQ